MNDLALQTASPKAATEAKQHLALFFDFLESHALISSVTHYNLTLFSKRSLPEEDRKRIVNIRLGEWCRVGGERFRSRFAGMGVGMGVGMGMGVVEGWFEIYRVRGNFVLLKEKELCMSLFWPSFLFFDAFELTKMDRRDQLQLGTPRSTPSSPLSKCAFPVRSLPT